MIPLATDRLRILHLSDLHFVGKLHESGTRWATGSLGTKSHSFAKLSAVRTTIEMGLGHREPGAKRFDHLLVTGDVSTDGAQDSLRTARSWIQQDEFFRLSANRLRAYGLSSSDDETTIIPGNHDRYGRFPLQGRQRHFEQIFGEPDGGYPYIKILKADPSSGRPDVVLFVFDSTQTLGIRQRFWKPQQRVAEGEVGLAECDSLLVRSRRIADEGHWRAINVDRARCVRIAVLHHHPRLPAEGDRCKSRPLMGMANSELFERRCVEAGINLVLFGHQHCAYQLTAVPSSAGETPFGPSAPSYLFCCASTSEYSAKDAGFYVYDIAVGGVDIYEFTWAGQGFTQRPEAMQLTF